MDRRLRQDLVAARDARSCAFRKSAGASLKNIWQITPGRGDEPDAIYCGVEPSALFESRDAGETLDAERRASGIIPTGRSGCRAAAACASTRSWSTRRVPGRMTVATSTGGAYRSDDGGRSWQVKNRGVRAEFLPDPYPEFGQCVHKIAQRAPRPGRLFLQNHWGLYRSDDGGDSWKDIANGVPSDFGFCMGVHPRDPDTAFIVPLHSDGFRCTPDGKLRVYRTRDAGASWQALTRGLPQKDAFETVVRDAMAVDRARPGRASTSARAAASSTAPRDEGRTWALVREGLPPIVCVKAGDRRQRCKRAARPGAPQRRDGRGRPPDAGRAS